MPTPSFLDCLESFLESVRRSVEGSEAALLAERRSGGWNKTNVEGKLRLLSQVSEWENVAVRAIYHEIAVLFEIALKKTALPAFELKLEALWEKYREKSPPPSLADVHASQQWSEQGPKSNISFLYLKEVSRLAESHYGFQLEDVSAFDLVRAIRDEVND